MFNKFIINFNNINCIFKSNASNIFLLVSSQNVTKTKNIITFYSYNEYDYP